MALQGVYRGCKGIIISIFKKCYVQTCPRSQELFRCATQRQPMQSKSANRLTIVREREA